MSMPAQDCESTRSHDGDVAWQSRTKSPADMGESDGPSEVEDVSEHGDTQNSEYWHYGRYPKEPPTSPLTSLVHRHVRTLTTATVHHVLEQPAAGPSPRRRPSLERDLSMQEVDEKSQRAVDWFHKVQDANAKARPVEDIETRLNQARLKRRATLEGNGSQSAGSKSAPMPVPISNSRPRTPATVRLAATARNWDSFGMLLGVTPKAQPKTPPAAPNPKMPSFLHDPFYRQPKAHQARRRTIE